MLNAVLRNFEEVEGETSTALLEREDEARRQAGYQRRADFYLFEAFISTYKPDPVVSSYEHTASLVCHKTID